MLAVKPGRGHWQLPPSGWLSEEPGRTTRTFLSPPMRDVHAYLGAWMQRSGHVGRRGRCRQSARRLLQAPSPDRPRLFIGSHLDTVPDAGAFDGVLGVVLASRSSICWRRPLPFSIEVVGFSEEEGVRFGVPFIGSRALAGTLDDDLLGRVDAHGRSVADAIRDFGLDPSCVGNARADDGRLAISSSTSNRARCSMASPSPLGIVNAIVGQSRLP